MVGSKRKENIRNKNNQFKIFWIPFEFIVCLMRFLESCKMMNYLRDLFSNPVHRNEPRSSFRLEASHDSNTRPGSQPGGATGG